MTNEAAEQSQVRAHRTGLGKTTATRIRHVRW